MFHLGFVTLFISQHRVVVFGNQMAFRITISPVKEGMYVSPGCLLSKKDSPYILLFLS